MSLRASLIIVASVLALDAIPREAHAAPADMCPEIDATCDGHANPTCTKNEDCAADLPNCDVRYGRCVGACMFDYKKDGVLPMACADETRPFCNDEGRCTECREEEVAACVKPEGPVCVFATGSCGCNVSTDCASGICDGATRRCIAKVVSPSSSSGRPGIAGASSDPASPPEVGGTDLPGATRKEKPTVAAPSFADSDGPDGGRLEGGACSVSRTQSGAVVAIGLLAAVCGFVVARRVSRRRAA